jgi:hypothetical protein
MELFQPAYQALLARQATGDPTPDIHAILSASDDSRRQKLWSKLDEALGVDAAATLMELWDEAAQHARRGLVRGAA